MTTRSLEERLRDVEDRLEILNLIAAHPPGADTGADTYIRTAWTEDGVLDLGSDKTMNGRDTIASHVRIPGHQAAIEFGICHFAGLPHIALNGDTAVVTSYLQILVPQDQGEPVDVPNHGVSKGFRIHRAGANRWDLVRTKEGWKIKHRVSAPMNTNTQCVSTTCAAPVALSRKVRVSSRSVPLPATTSVQVRTAMFSMPAICCTR